MQRPCPDTFNLSEYVLSASARTPEKVALSMVGPSDAVHWRYGAVRAAVCGIGAGLLQLGLKPGDRILLRLGNCVEFPLAFLAAIRVGILPVPTAASLTGSEISKLADLVDPAAVLSDGSCALPDRPAQVIDLNAVRGMFELTQTPPEMGSGDRPAYITFTSGTSGTPRAVLHAHRAIWARRMMHEGWCGLRASDRLMHAGALNWSYTLGTGVLDPWAVGATAIIPLAGTAPAQLPMLLERHKVTLFAGAPGHYRQMLRAPDFPNLPLLRHGVSAGEKLPEALRAAWLAATGTDIHESMGMTECSTFLSGSPSRPAPANTLGFAQPGRKIAVLDDAGHPSAPGETGQLAVARDDPGLMLGYWRDEAATQARYSGAWFLTGDLVAETPEGAVTYVGRIDDQINAGGLRVGPLEVEQAFLQHPDITACAAVELEVATDIRVIALAYEGRDLDEKDLQTFAEPRLARYKQPRVFRHFETLPRTGNGKLNRSAVRAIWSKTYVDQT